MKGGSGRLVVLVALIVLAVASLLASAAIPEAVRAASAGTAPPAAPAAAVATRPAAEDALGRETPRGSALGYLQAARAGDYERAAEYLDLRRVSAAERPALGPQLARQLKIVLDRTLWVDLDTLSDAPEGHQDDGLRPSLDRIGTIATRRGPVDVLLERLPAGEGRAVWKVASQTVSQIPALYAEFGFGPLGDLLPAPLFEIRFLEIALWQWIGLLLVGLLALAGSWLVARLAVRLLRLLAARSRTPLDDSLLRAAIGPLRLAIGLVLFGAGTLALGLSVPVQQVVSALLKALGIVAVAWFFLRAADVLAQLAGEQLAARGRASAVSVVPLGRKAVKVAVTGLALIALLQNLGVNVTGILAGLGVGGLAVALAAQKTVENLFGGITLIADQPVRVGDFCRFGDKVGTIEEIGLRSTRVRTLDRTVVSIPNAEFATLQLENFAKRDRIWLKATLSLRYETTPDQLRYVLVELRRLLYAHPKVHPDPARVRFVGFGPYSLDVELFAYVGTTNFDEFLAVREDLFLRIMDIVAASGTGFAFPSSTTYLRRDGGLDEARSRAAEAQVRQWRERGELCLPEFPPEQIAALGGTLDYPPRGSAVRQAG